MRTSITNYQFSLTNSQSSPSHHWPEAVGDFQGSSPKEFQNAACRTVEVGMTNVEFERGRHRGPGLSRGERGLLSLAESFESRLHLRAADLLGRRDSKQVSSHEE